MAGLLNCCTWEGSYGSSECEVQRPGVGACGILFCLPEVTVEHIPCDAAAPTTTGLIRDVAKSGTINGRFMTVATNATGESLLTVQGTESLNDNGGVSPNETLTGQGSLTAQDFCFLKNLLGKEVCLIWPLNNGKIGVWGWNGGMRLTSRGYAIGQSSDDFIGTNFEFTNSTRDLFSFYDLTLAGTYNTYEELVTALTT